MSNKWRRFILYPFIAGVSLSILIVLLFIHIYPAIELKVVENVQLKNNCKVFYADCDHDGYSERFNYCSYGKIFPQTLYMYNYQENLKGLWNVYEEPLGEGDLFTGDFDMDNTDEIYLFTQTLDSVFLYIFDAQDDKNHITYRKFITLKPENSRLEIEPVGLYFMNEGQKKDFVFMIRSSAVPKLNKVAFFDISQQKLHFSPSLNVYIKRPIVIDDINNDGNMELLVSNESIAKELTEVESKLIVLNDKLQNLFAPVVFKGAASQVTVAGINDGKLKHIAVMHSSLLPNSVFNTFMLYNTEGKRVVEKIMNEKSGVKLLDIPDSREKIFLLAKNKCLVKDINCNNLIEIDFNSDTVGFVNVMDINGDNRNEFIFKDKHNVYFVSNNLSHRKQLQVNTANGTITSSILAVGLKPMISLQAGKQWFVLNYWENNSFFTSYLFYLAVFFICIVFVFFCFRIYGFIQAKQKARQERDILHFEKSVIDAQVVNDINSKHKNTNESIDGLLQINKNNTSDKSECTSVDIRKQMDSILFANSKSKIRYSIFPEYWGGFPSEFCVDLNHILKGIIDAIDTQHCEADIELIKHKNCLNVSIEILCAEENKSNILDSLLTIREQFNHGRAFEVEEIKNAGIVVNVSFAIEKAQFKQTATGKIKVIIAEDHDVSLFGLTSLFKTKEDIEIVGTARNGMEVLKILESKKANIVITDISMPGMDGIELTEKLQKDYPAIKVIVFTMYMENWFVEQLIQNGAKAFVSKSSKINELIEAVRNVNEGGNYYCPQFKSKFGFNGSSNKSEKIESLNRSEMEILKLYAENLNKEEIASHLSINPKTFDSFVSNILLKLNAAGEEELKKIAKMQKFVSE